MLAKKLKLFRRIAFLLGVWMLIESFLPNLALALTSGPSQPEFSSFEPVATTNMVNEFTGDFTYNLPVLQIPGAHGGDYALSLSYHSGASPEEEASWVGYGWTLNPGAINRNKRGFPDDHKGKEVTFFNRAPKNQTVSVSSKLAPEIFSYSSNKLPVTLPLNGALRFNNYKGFGYVAGISLAAKGIGNLGFGFADGQGTANYSIQPTVLLNKYTKKKLFEESALHTLGLSKKQFGPTMDKYLETASAQFGSVFGATSYSVSAKATNITEYTGLSTNVSTGGTIDPALFPSGAEIGFVGHYAYQQNKTDPTTGDQLDRLETYGYMYSGDAHETSMRDYYTEKDQPYTKQDKFLGIPFSNADQFAVTGEGLVGGFRLHTSCPGHFYQNQKHSHITIENLGLETQNGNTVGVGSETGVGFQDFRVQNWKHTGNTDNQQFPTSDSLDEAYFFRYTNDLGGSVEYEGPQYVEDAVTRAALHPSSSLGFQPMVSEISLKANSLNFNRAGRAGYIGYHTNGEMEASKYSQSLGTNVWYNSYSKDAAQRQHVKRSGKTNSIYDQIGEIASFNENGMRYVYGLPVYSKNEKNIQYGITGSIVDDRFIMHVDDPELAEIKVGEQRNTPYATTYLLTEITTPDYVDRSLNGPSDDDFGGWTKFSYRQEFGSSGTIDKATEIPGWYHWRIPYTGFYYHRNDLSDPRDDLGSFMSGDKEIYYLETIETKTHIAIFTTQNRDDAYSAPIDDEADGNPLANPSTPKALQKLVKIELYTKKDWQNGNNPAALPVKTVRFEYHGDHDPNEQGAWPGTPNSPGGKLTLKKVWFEYDGIQNARISPYQFHYQYFDLNAANSNGELDHFSNAYKDILQSTQLLDENPNYDRNNIDAWGNYRPDDIAGNNTSRRQTLQNWVYQGNNTNTQYDPAAWQLKRIVLPSGGEVQVQYEEDDYQYVQDRNAMAMANLLPDGNGANCDGSNAELCNTYLLDMASIGLQTTDEKKALAALINSIAVDQRLYYKFLYQLKGSNTPATLGECSGEYISGYAAATANYDQAADKFTIEFLALGDAPSLPHATCKDFYRSNRAGMIGVWSDKCNPAEGVPGDTDDAKAQVLNAAKYIGTKFIPNNTCRVITPELSYIRVPLPKAKKGGGFRVKRLLMFDKGMEKGDAVLYGNEYFYQTYDEALGKTISSGVASNEPPEIREENALVGWRPRFKQSTYDRLISGRDKEVSEGPLGESILPAASIGYSQVYSKSIHTGKTDAGYSVKEFFTCKDYPFDGNYPLLGPAVHLTEIKEKKSRKPLPAVVINYNEDKRWLSQGFRFLQTNMNGQVKRLATYAGNLADPSDYFNAEKSVLSTLQEFDYYQPGEKIPMLYDLEHYLDPLTGVVYENPGKEVEVVYEMRSIEEVIKDATLEGDVSFAPSTLTPYAATWASGSYSEEELNTHVTSKVIRYPAIQKSVLTFQDGIYHLTQNEAFSPYNGQPLVARTTDGFHNLDLKETLANGPHDGSYRSYQFPAAKMYDAMGQKAINEGLYWRNPYNGHSIKVLPNTAGIELVFEGLRDSEDCHALGQFASGDLLELSFEGVTESQLYHVLEVTAPDRIQLIPAPHHGYDAGMVVNEASELKFLKVLESGRTNELNAVAGGITTYGEREEIVTESVFPLNANTPRAKLADFLNNLILDATNNDLVNKEFISNNLFNVDVLFENSTSNSCEEELSDKKIESINYTAWIDYANQELILSVDEYFNIGQCTFSCSCIADGPETIENGDFSSGATGFLTDLMPCFLANSCTTFTQRGQYSVGLLSDASRLFQDNDTSGCALAGDADPRASGNFLIVQGPDVKNDVIWQQTTAVQPYTQYLFSMASVWLDQGIKVPDFEISINDQVIYSSAGNPYAHCKWLTYPSCVEWFSGDQNTAKVTIRSSKSYDPNNTTLRGLRFGIDNISLKAFTGCCQARFPVPGIDEIINNGRDPLADIGKFEVDPLTGEIVYRLAGSNCEPYTLSCFSFAHESLIAKHTLPNVLAASAQTFKDDWSYDPSTITNGPAFSDDPFENGEKGKWRTHKTYTYRTDVIDGVDADNANPTASKAIYKDAGVFEDFALFDWEHPGANDTKKWLELNTITQYSPNGEPLEEVDILGIPSTAKFEHDQTVPSLVAQNASFHTVLFESFEETGSLVPAHTGKQAAEILPLNSLTLNKTIQLDHQIFAQGLLASFWMKVPEGEDAANQLNLTMSHNGNSIQFNGQFERIAQAGEWGLYEAKLIDPLYQNGKVVKAGDNLLVHLENRSNQTWQVDDIRLQPYDAQLNAFVYDPNTLRLIANFDDQHFALLYQYNAEGRLVRKLKETERGVKTLEETQYVTPEKDRN